MLVQTQSMAEEEGSDQTLTNYMPDTRKPDQVILKPACWATETI